MIPFAVIPGYITSPFWFVVVFGLLYIFFIWLFNRENEIFEKDRTRSIGPSAAWAILSLFAQYLFYASGVWLIVALIVFIFSHF